MDLQNHIDNPGPPNDGYVSTSLSPEAAAPFSNFTGGGGYLYQIDRPPNGIDVSKEPDIRPNPAEQEVAVPGRIPPETIVGAQPLSPDLRPTGPFIPNPIYVGPNTPYFGPYQFPGP
jgi:hypothetical protein